MPILRGWAGAFSDLMIDEAYVFLLLSRAEPNIVASMADIKIPFSAGTNGPCGEWGEHGERGERGKRGHCGEIGPTGTTGTTGPAGPAGTPGTTGPTGFPPVIAAEIVAAAGTFLQQTGRASLTQPAPGEYDFQLINPPVVASNTIPVGMILSNVFTYDASGTRIDRLFSAWRLRR
jgi:hypothetical protein